MLIIGTIPHVYVIGCKHKAPRNVAYHIEYEYCNMMTKPKVY